MRRSLFHHSTKAAFTGLASTWHGQGVNTRTDGKRDKRKVLDEAYDEYCRMRDAGETVLPSEFCNRYPTYCKSLRRLIDVHDNLELIPDVEQDSWPECGQEFLGFEVLHELGIGAIARVYLAAEHALGGRFVAIKVSLYGDDEADTLGKLSHPNVVPVHSVQVDPDTGMTAVCMPYLGSATLSDVLDLAFAENKPPSRADVILTAAEERDFLAGFIDRAYVGSDTDRMLTQGSYVDGVVHLGVQLAEALAYTHSQGILHRDLKPSNVLLTPSGRPMLLDFNLSCDVQLDVNRVGGTLPYMPPEQIREVHMPPADGHLAGDPRSDIFSLGVILYELLAGRLPFGDPPHGASPKEAGAAYLEMQQQPPANVRQCNPQVDRPLAETINRCLSQDPADRPESAAELALRLKRRFVATQRLKRWSYQRRWMLSLAAVLLSGTVGALVYYVVNLPPLDVRLCNSAVAALREGRYTDG
ncbi:MAG: serine/threonine-protein kinase, partial [Pirellulaceae bacterium]